MKACASTTLQRLQLTALASLLLGLHAAQAGIRNDEAYPPVARDPFAEDAEGQDILDRIDWENQRFGGPLDSDFYERTLQAILAQAARHPELLPNATAPANVPRWKSLGPTSQQVSQNGISLRVQNSGRVRGLLVHPTDPETLYLLSAGGGLWKTTNFSAAYPIWTAVTDSALTTSGGAVAMGSDPQTIYLGLGDPFDGIALLGGYMMRSTDGGTTWSTPVKLSAAAGIVTDVKVDSSGGSDVVLAATNAGLFRSTNGVSYSAVSGIPATVAITTSGGVVTVPVAISSLVKTSAGWLASTFGPDPSYRYGIGGSHAVYLSTDRGATWTAVPTAARFGTTQDQSRTTLAVGAPGDATVYAVGSTAWTSAVVSSQSDVYKSLDGGITWAALAMNGRTPTNPNANQPNLNVLNTQAWYNQMLVVDPTSPTRSTVHLGGNLSIVKTTNGGTSWTVQTNWLAQYGLAYVHADEHAATYSVSGAKRLFVGNDGGLFYSDDGGSTWSDRKNSGLVNHLIYAMSTSGADPSGVIAGLQDNGTIIRINGTTVYNQTIGGDGFGTGQSQANAAAVLGSLYYNQIKYTAGVAPTDQSLWTNPTLTSNFGSCPAFYNGLDTCNAYFATTVAVPNAAADATGKLFYARSFNDVYRTSNGAASWASISTSDPNRAGNTIRSAQHVIGVHPTNGAKVAAAASGARVRYTLNGGTSWTTVTMPAGITGGFNSNVAWISDTSFFVASENAGTQPGNCWLARSNDLGVTWQTACAGLPNVPLTKVLVSPADPTGRTVYAATWIGVYKSSNGGASWDQFGAGLPVVKVSDLYMPPRGGFLRVSTYGRGIWEIPTPR